MTIAAAVAMIGPIRGATIIAPITVAVESESIPKAAMTVANNSSTKMLVNRYAVLGPWKNILVSKASI